jgi:guanylate kinase
MEGKIVNAVTTTTRPPRPGERDGIDYHFFCEHSFLEILAADGFLEHSRVHNQYLYGLRRQEVEKHLHGNRDILLNVNIDGAAKLRSSLETQKSSLPHLRVVTIFLLPPPLEELIRRIRQRSRMDDRELESRIHSLQAEIAAASSYHYSIPNGTPEETLDNMRHIYHAENMRNELSQ